MTKSKTKKTTMPGRGSSADESTLGFYFKEISKIPLLSKEEEEKIAKLAAEGNTKAREKLVNSNLRFVISMARKYQGRGLPLEDLISEGNMGLLNAASRFDPEKGYRFITYAVWWIRQSIIKAISEKGRMIRLPGNMINDLGRINKTREAFLNEQGCKAGTEIEKVALFLEMPAKKAEHLLQSNQDVVSLNDPALRHEDSISIGDLIENEASEAPVEKAFNSVLRDELENVIDGLGGKAADVIRYRYGLGSSGPLTLTEIGERCNLSRERVRQIEKRALGQLEKSSKSRDLEGFIA